MRRRHRFALALSAGFAALGVLSLAHADGEAGLVIQDGDVVTTYCVPFTGDSISGDQILKQAGHTFDAYGGGSGLAVCSIDSKGCNDAGSFSSCFCQCQGGDCTYWAFFTRAHGRGWVYSALAFNLLKAKDGDVHGWKWGKGGPNSAPAPADVTFEQICGHSPRGGATQASPTIGTSPTTIPTLVIPTAPATTAVTQAPTSSETVPPRAATAQSTPLVTISNAASPPASASVATDVLDASPNEDGGGAGTLVAFAAIAGALLLALAAAAVWRARHDA